MRTLALSLSPRWALPARKKRGKSSTQPRSYDCVAKRDLIQGAISLATRGLLHWLAAVYMSLTLSPATKEPKDTDKPVVRRPVYSPSRSDLSTSNVPRLTMPCHHLKMIERVARTTANRLLSRAPRSVRNAYPVDAKFVPSLYAIPGVGLINRYVGMAEDVARYDDPKAVEKLNGDLRALLTKQGKQEASFNQLFTNHSYTPAMRRIVLQKLQSIEKRGGDYSPFVEAAAGAGSRGDARTWVALLERS